MPDEPDPSFGVLSVAISMPCEGWLTELPDVDNICLTAATAAYRGAANNQSSDTSSPPDPATEISVVLADDQMVRGLNRDYRDQDEPTNVLSFPQGDDGLAPDGAERMLGDVILALETTAREAAGQAKSLSAHTSHLVVHGVLHLMGFDHVDDGEAEDMEALEKKILAALSIADPYRAESFLRDDAS